MEFIITTFFIVIFLSLLWFLIKKDSEGIMIINVIYKADLILGKDVLAKLSIKMITELIMMFVLNTISILIVDYFTNINIGFLYFWYILSFIPVLIFRIRINKEKQKYRND